MHIGAEYIYVLSPLPHLCGASAVAGLHGETDHAKALE